MVPTLRGAKGSKAEAFTDFLAGTWLSFLGESGIQVALAPMDADRGVRMTTVLLGQPLSTSMIAGKRVTISTWRSDMFGDLRMTNSVDGALP